MLVRRNKYPINIKYYHRRTQSLNDLDHSCYDYKCLRVICIMSDTYHELVDKRLSDYKMVYNKTLKKQRIGATYKLEPKKLSEFKRGKS